MLNISIVYEMPFPSLIAVLRAESQSDKRSAYLTPFGIKPLTVEEEFGVEHTKVARSGCRVPRLSVSIHCSEPHLECAAHVMESAFNYTVSNALPNGTVEEALLITPRPEPLGASGETYPLGNPEDLIISRREIEALVSRHPQRHYDSLIVRLPSEYLQTIPGSDEIMLWPYLSSECAVYVRSLFHHFRTNAPSVERAQSGGGMWNHWTLFNLPEGDFSYDDYNERRTIGELFSIPYQIPDGQYHLICPFLEMKADCALVVPLLYSCN